MQGPTRRKYPRYPLQRPILFRGFEKNRFHPAKTLDNSMGGMCFVCDFHIKPKDVITIKMDGPSGAKTSDDYRVYEAQVKWCSRPSVFDKTAYTVGVQYLVKSLYPNHENLAFRTYTCDFCGRVVPCGDSRKYYNFIHVSKNFAFLCSQCFSGTEQIYEPTLGPYLVGTML